MPAEVSRWYNASTNVHDASRRYEMNAALLGADTSSPPMVGTHLNAATVPSLVDANTPIAAHASRRLTDERRTNPDTLATQGRSLRSSAPCVRRFG
jgi:hypothetical protein